MEDGAINTNDSDALEEIKELTENQEKLNKLSKKELEILESIEKWLKENRGYKDYDFTDEFKVDKLLALIRLVEHDEIEFVYGDKPCIIQRLRNPIEMTNRAGDVEKTISELKYRTRYQDYELQNYTKGINVSKEPMTYISAQIALLTTTARSIIGKLYDTDSGVTKLISALYFLG